MEIVTTRLQRAGSIAATPYAVPPPAECPIRTARITTLGLVQPIDVPHIRATLIYAISGQRTWCVTSLPRCDRVETTVAKEINGLMPG
ncbi:hypothetical protein KDA_52280 [Dictyobacter alpinus]|uniref:Uncharacterized protein n=1 Tax=Dictyobacter alpinus TaxID=2014873 RepID=A0A402BED7_9CHLR|nr:hypothetical protein KDA_52280 [Dictyobacter alpinus]